MNCDKCTELLSDYVDQTLSHEEHVACASHLEECLPCFHLYRDFDSIVATCAEEYRGTYEAPPNPQALWIRIRNVIEAEQPRAAVAGAASGNAYKPASNFLTRWINRSWELSFSQMAMAVSAIVLTVALGTAFSLRQMHSLNSPAATTASAAENQTSNRDRGHVDELIRRQQMAIDYWRQRVEQRKGRWNPRIREAFESNLSILDQTVNEQREHLLRNPHDELSEEMLSTALTDQVELLKEFSDL